MTIRKLRNDEVRQAARRMAEEFYDYPLYDAFFPRDEKRKERVFYFFWYRLYTRRGCTYVTDGLELVCSVLRPGERENSPLGLLLNPAFTLGFLRRVPLSVLGRVREYSAMERALRERHYRPQRDWYVQTVCLMKRARREGAFRELAALLEGKPLYCETHAARNARLYRMLGIRVCAEQEWRGITHYVMRREAGETA